MKTYLLISYFIFIFIKPIFGDCVNSNSFITDAFKADIVVLAAIHDSYHHGYILKIIEVWRGKLNHELILAWSSSECEPDRDEISGSVGDTLLVSLSKKVKNDTCESKYFKFIEKFGENVYQTQECGTNVLKFKNGQFIGQISIKVGTFIENGESKFYKYEEQKMPYYMLAHILMVLK